MPEILAAGKCAKFDARFEVKNEEIFSWDLETWERLLGQYEARHHGVPDEYLPAVEAYLASCKEGDLIDVSKAYPYEKFSSRPVKIADLLRRVQRFAGTELEPYWDRDCTSVAESRMMLEKLATYGVVNARRLKNLSFKYPGVFRKWKTTVHNVWIGTSMGGLHHDAFDNTLIQLSGRKRVIVYPPDLTDAVAATDVEEHGTGYPEFPATTFLAPSTLATHPYLKYFPYYTIDLEPGEGVIIPARAYHAASARSHDSISINSFLLPYLAKGPFTYVRSVRRMAPIASTFLSLNRVCLALTGRCVRQGPYEFI
jgi:hypothetical protein